MTHAFFTVAAAGEKLSPEDKVRVTKELAAAAGAAGMVGGQAMDMGEQRKQARRPATLETVQNIHRLKTGKLITAAVRMGAIAAGAEGATLACLSRFAENFGLAYQITDDLLDILGDEEELGKRVGSDAEAGKATFPAVIGVKESRRMAQEAVADAVAGLKRIEKDTGVLEKMANFVIDRNS